MIIFLEQQGNSKYASQNYRGFQELVIQRTSLTRPWCMHILKDLSVSAPHFHDHREMMEKTLLVYPFHEGPRRAEKVNDPPFRSVRCSAIGISGPQKKEKQNLYVTRTTLQPGARRHLVSLSPEICPHSRLSTTYTMCPWCRRAYFSHVKI